MKKVLSPLLLIFFLIGCQNQTVNSDKLQSDAYDVYNIIKNDVLHDDTLSNNEKEKLDQFENVYIKNIKNYSSDDQKLISNIESLTYSRNFYYVSIGLKDKNGISMYKQRLDALLSTLDKNFNK